MTGRDAPHFRLRVDPKIKEWIETQAVANHRSVTGEINYRLEEAMKKEAAGVTSQA